MLRNFRASSVICARYVLSNLSICLDKFSALALCPAKQLSLEPSKAPYIPRSVKFIMLGSGDPKKREFPSLAYSFPQIAPKTTFPPFLYYFPPFFLFLRAYAFEELLARSINVQYPMRR